MTVRPKQLIHRFRYLIETRLGYHGDVNATYPVGKIDEDDKKLIRTTRESLDAAIKLCKPGALFRDLGKTMYAPSLPSLV